MPPISPTYQEWTLMEQEYPAVSTPALTDAQRQEFYDWCVTHYGAEPSCRYCGWEFDPCIDPWHHAQRETMWDLYTDLRDSVNTWATMPMPTKSYLDGLYGRDYE